MGQFSMQIYRHPVPTSFNQFHYVPVQGPILVGYLENLLLIIKVLQARPASWREYLLGNGRPLEGCRMSRISGDAPNARGH